MTEQLDDWVSRFADELIADAEQRGAKVVCASGISPSGGVHLGNLREVMTPHFVADEVRRRGIECEHIISWDDYDRFRKVPFVAGVDESWAEHIGKPLTAVPAPKGSRHDSWAAHFRSEFEESLAQLGIRYRGISQTEQYTSGAYTEQILFAMSRRAEIDAVLERYRTLAKQDAQQQSSSGRQQKKLDPADEAAAAEAAVGSGAAAEDDGGSATGYYPYKPYCTGCGTDFTTVTGYDDDTFALSYTCRCGFAETVDLKTFHRGKLVWKVDWPMRWAYEKVLFEPSGVDHQSPGSSFVVGLDLAPIFGWQRPIGPMYAFVGLKGMAKMSSSKGGVPTPREAMQIMEPSVLRWMYARRKPNQAFNVSFDAEIMRMYDEWDSLGRKVGSGAGQPGDIAALARASSTAEGALPSTAVPVAFRTLASIVDITTGDEQQALRIVGQLDPAAPAPALEDLRPRLDCVERWVATQMTDEEKTIVRAEPAGFELDEEQRASLKLLLDGGDGSLGPIENGWSLDGLTHQVYGVPKVRRGLTADQIVKGDKDLSAAQREFFKLLYAMLIDKETGPRLPTLLLAIGPQRVRELLTPGE